MEIIQHPLNLMASFSGPMPASLPGRIWDGEYEPEVDSAVPVYDDINAALRYYKTTAADLSPPTVISAQTIQIAADMMEERIRSSWKAHGSAYLFSGHISVQMFVIPIFRCFMYHFTDKIW
jgi:hypothetical protein